MFGLFSQMNNIQKVIYGSLLLILLSLLLEFGYKIYFGLDNPSMMICWNLNGNEHLDLMQQFNEIHR